MGRRPKSAGSPEAVDTENMDVVLQEPAAAAARALESREEERKRLIEEGKQSTIPIAFEFRPYYNRPKKHGLCKLILVRENKVRGHIYRNLIARNIKQVDAQKLTMLPIEQIGDEHERRAKLPRYGF